MALPKLFDRIFWHNNTTPAINEDNLNSMSKAIDDIDDRVISLAGTIMEDVPQIIEDMEILEPAIESIDENVARAEAAAESAEQYAEEIAPPIEVVKDYASIITLSDAINKPVKDLKVKVEPFQDLHGYTKPWPSGAGKNLFPLTLSTIKSANTDGTWADNVYTINSATATVYTDDGGNVTGIKCNGTPSGGNFTLNLNSATSLSYDNLGGKKVSGCAGGSGSTYDLRVVYRGSTGNWVTSDAQTTSEITIRSGVANVSYIQLMILCVANKQINETFYPMISTDGGAFEPYTNICPITGHSEAKVTRAGHNLINVTATSQTINGVTFIVNNNRTVTVSTDSGGATAGTGLQLFPTFSNNSISIENGDYILSGCPSQSGQNLAIFGDNRSSDGSTTINGVADYGNEANISITQGRFRAYIFIASGTVITTPVTFKPMLRPATDSDTTYEPYTPPDIYIIELDGTRYGGVLDVTTGALTLTHTYKEFTSSDATTWYTTPNTSRFFTGWTKVGKTNVDVGLSCISSAYKNVFKNIEQSNLDNGEFVFNTNRISSGNDCIVLKDTRFNTVEDFKASLTTPLQLVYELATPTTVQLTPTEVDLFLGYNTLWADTGDLSLTYDASGVLRIANAKLDIDTFKSVVAASSDFADFKSRVAAL